MRSLSPNCKTGSTRICREFARPSLNPWCSTAISRTGRTSFARHISLPRGVTGALLFLFGTYLAQHTGMQPQAFSFAAILTGGVIAGFGWFMPDANRGWSARASQYPGLRGFSEPRRGGSPGPDAAISRENFEKYLPFAMALGVEKKWVGAFDGMLTQPSWYLDHRRGRFPSHRLRKQPRPDGRAHRPGDGFRAEKFGQFGIWRRRRVGRRLWRRGRRRISEPICRLLPTLAPFAGLRALRHSSESILHAMYRAVIY